MRMGQMAASSKLVLRAETGSKYSSSRMFTLIAIAFVLAVTMMACAPIPCASGYADPNWCRHFSGSSDGG
jgi:hypothetical protein